MNPDEKEMLNRAVRLSEENNQVLLSLEKKVRFMTIWGIIKVFLIVLPLVISYFYLQPYFGTVGESLTNVKQLLDGNSF